MLPLIAAIWFIFDTMCQLCMSSSDWKNTEMPERERETWSMECFNWHGGHDDILWLQDPIGWEEQSLPFDLQWNVYKVCMVVFVFTLPSLCPEAFSWNVYNWVWVQVVSDLEPPSLCGFTRLPGSTLPYTDFTILCPHYPTPPYFGMALLNCSTQLYLTQLCSTIP